MDTLKLKDAIRKFHQEQENVYKASPKRIQRDFATARKSTKDHVGRWLFEIIQNSDDAEATSIEINISEDCLYVADNGIGFKPDAVESISGTDYSDKPAGAIGRKGVGFKSVYQITDNPKILTLNGDGLQFHKKLSKDWFDERNLSVTQEEVPFQWIPFYISRKQAEEENSLLKEYSDWGTVVILPFKDRTSFKDAIELIKDWSSNSLFSLNHIRNVTIVGENSSYSVSLKKDDGVWILSDSRKPYEEQWRVLKKKLIPPNKVIQELDVNDRKHVQEISFVIAAPIGEDGVINATEEQFPLHVFYPTEVPSPVPLFIHAEFLVKNDRTAILPIEKSEFNTWVANRVSDLIIEYVNSVYTKDYPSRYLHLLMPLKDSQYTTTETLLKKIYKCAMDSLSLPGVDGEQRLSISEAVLLNLSCVIDAAYDIAITTDSKKSLLHRSLVEDKEAVEVVSFAECKLLSDKQFIELISQYLSKHKIHKTFVWSSLNWLANWVDNIPYYSKNYKERVQIIKDIPIIPIQDKLHSLRSLESSVISWQYPIEKETIYPDWLKIKFVDDWFAQKIDQLERYNSNIPELLKLIQLKEYDNKVLTNGIKKAIEDYWNNKSIDPGEIFRLLFDIQSEVEIGWSDLSECPVYIRSKTTQKERWAPAEKVYLGKEWDYGLIETIYKGNDEINWAEPLKDLSIDDQKSLLLDLYCMPHPRIHEKKVRNTRLHSFDDKYTSWLKTGIDREYNPNFESIDGIHELDQIDLTTLSSVQSAALLRLIVMNWYEYYCIENRTIYRWIPRSREDSKSVVSYWLYDLKENLKPPIKNNYAESEPILKCWLPDVYTQRSIGDFLPIVDEEAFGNDSAEVSDWLIKELDVRQSLGEVLFDEWSKIIGHVIPNLVDDNDLDDSRFRDKIIRCYEACIDSLKDQHPLIHPTFDDLQLICRKGSLWNLKPSDEIFLADNLELSYAFTNDCWQLDIAKNYQSSAKKIFDLKLLTEETDVETVLGNELIDRSSTIQKTVYPILPYIYAWRCSKSKRHQELKQKLSELSIKVVDKIVSYLTMDGIEEKEISKKYYVEDYYVYLNTSGLDYTSLALALSEMLGVKSEADFYENLLGCDGRVDDLREKMISKEMTETTLDRYLRDFLGNNLESNASVSIPNTKSRPNKSSKTEISIASSQGVSKLTGNPKDRTKDNSSFNSKDIQNENIEFLSSKKSTKSSVKINSSSTNQNATKSRSNISHEDRMAIEESGRSAAEIKLKEFGYDVKQMPGHNPGFDIRAIKDGLELRVEIKAHKSRVNSAELTQTEYQEYIKCQELENVNWELWNIENLSGNSHENITITRYKLLNEDAFNTRIMTINLSNCDSVETDSEL